MKSIQKLDDAHLNMTFCNSSDFDLNELEFSYQGSQYVITLLPAAGESSVIVQYSADWDSDHFMPPAPSEYFITTDPTTCKVRERYGKSMSDSKVAVYNLRGQRCDMPINYSSNNVEADMSKSGSGLYILKLEIPGEKTRIMKFIHHK